MTRPDPIPVKYLRFNIPMDAPGLQVASSCTAGERFVIEYQPWLRHHRIEYRPQTGPVKVAFVPEAHVKSWEPMPAVVEQPTPELPIAKRK